MRGTRTSRPNNHYCCVWNPRTIESTHQEVAMRGFSPPLYPKQKRKARVAEAYGAGASATPSRQKAEASRMFQRLGGVFRGSRSGASKLKPKFIKG